MTNTEKTLQETLNFYRNEAIKSEQIKKQLWEVILNSDMEASERLLRISQILAGVK